MHAGVVCQFLEVEYKLPGPLLALLALLQADLEVVGSNLEGIPDAVHQAVPRDTPHQDPTSVQLV